MIWAAFTDDVVLTAHFIILQKEMRRLFLGLPEFPSYYEWRDIWTAPFYWFSNKKAPRFPDSLSSFSYFDHSIITYITKCAPPVLEGSDIAGARLTSVLSGILIANSYFWLFRWLRGFCKTIQAKKNKIGIHTGGRRSGVRNTLRKRVFPNHHL